MPKTRLWIILSVLVCAAIVAMGWFLGASPQLTAAGESNLQRANVEAQNASQRLLIADLKAKFENIDVIRGDVLALRDEVPSVVAMTDLINQIDELAAAHNLIIELYKAEEPLSPLAGVVAAAPPPEPVEPVEGEEPAPVEAPPAAAPGDLARTGPAPSGLLTAENLFVLPITFNFLGAPADVRAFVSELQAGERLFLVTSVRTSIKDPSEVKGFVYIVTDGAAPNAGTGIVN